MSSLDVIVPCYRYGRFLEECVQSLLSQDVENLRVLIIDDQSPDETFEVATRLMRQDSRVSVIRHEVNRGHIATYNEGIDWLRADYMLLLSADDYLLPGALRRAVAMLDADAEIGFVFGNVMEFGVNGFTRETSEVPGIIAESDCRKLSGRDFLALSGAGNIVPTPTAVVRTSLLQKLGGYRADLPHTADMELWFRLAAHADVGAMGAYQAVYRRHSANMSLGYLHSNRMPDLRERKAAIEAFFQTHGAGVEGAKDLRVSMLRALGRDAIGYASAAFNNHEIEACRQLTIFARDTSPTLARSMPWFLLSCKRTLGSRRWLAVQPAIASIRQLAQPRKSRVG